MKKEEKSFNILKTKNNNKFLECLEVCGLMAGFSIVFIPPIALFGYYANFSGIVYFILYIILVILQLFNPVIKKLFGALKKEDFEKFKNFIDPIIKTNLSLINRSKFESSNIKEV